MGLKCQEILSSLGVQLDPVSELGSLLHPSIHTLGGKMDSYSYTLWPHYRGSLKMMKNTITKNSLVLLNCI